MGTGPDPGDAVLAAILERSWRGAGQELRSAWAPETRLTARELLRFAATQRYCVLATTKPSGAPRALPVSFHLDTAARFWLPTQSHAARLGDLRPGSRGALVIGQGMGVDHSAVMAWGPMEIVAPEQISNTTTAALRDKLGELDWADRFLVLTAARIFGYGSPRANYSAGSSNLSPG